jgi:hypothetical protein
MWITQKSQLDAQSPFTEDQNGYVNTVTMGMNGSVGYKLKPFVGKKYKHNGQTDIEAGDSVNTFNQQFNLLLYYSNPQHKQAIEQVVNADDVIVFVQLNDGNIEIFGYDFGLDCTAGGGGTGTALNDDTAFTVTLSGLQKSLPKYFRASPSATLADNIAYLDAISETY